MYPFVEACCNELGATIKIEPYYEALDERRIDLYFFNIFVTTSKLEKAKRVWKDLHTGSIMLRCSEMLKRLYLSIGQMYCRPNSRLPQRLLMGLSFAKSLKIITMTMNSL